MIKFLEDFSDEATTLGLFLAALLALIGFWAWLRSRSEIPKVEVTNPPPALPPGTMLITPEAYGEMQKIALASTVEQLATAHGAVRKDLQDKIDALNARLRDPEEALAQQQAIITDLEAKLDRRGNDIGGDDLAAAKAALEAFDFTKARALFETLAARTAPEVAANADVEFALGQIAEAEIRWHDAARHYATAVRLNPTIATHHKAREFAWRAGDAPAAFRHGEALLALATASGTPEQRATALNEHGLTLNAQGRYPAAEALYLQALEIGRATIGEAHPSYAIRLNNLAAAVQAQGRYPEAEGLHRQALEIGRATIGAGHPDYAASLNNLAGVVEAQGRYPEAEKLYLQALEIARATIGAAHPNYATCLNNLALVVKAQGRYPEAEGLYRQALEIDRATIGAAHPDYATHLHNLAGVVKAQGRYPEAEGLYAEAIAILRKSLGDGHPNTRAGAKNFLDLITTHLPTSTHRAEIEALLAAGVDEPPAASA